MSILAYSLIFLTSIISIALYQSFHLPSEYKHLKAVSIIDFIKQLLSKAEIPERFEKLYRPILNKDGYGLIWQSTGWNLIVTSPKQIKEIILNTENFHKIEDKPNDYGQLRYRLFGKSNIVFSDQGEWRHHRKSINPAFKKAWNIDIFEESGKELIEKIEMEQGKGVYIHLKFLNLALDILGKGLFSYNFHALEDGEKNHGYQLYSKAMAGINDFKYFVFPILELIIPARKKVHQATEEFKTFLLSIIETKKKEVESGDVKDDIVSLMVKSSLDSSENGLSSTEILYNLSIFFAAGHDTTANTLTSTIYFLSKHKDIQKKAREEVLNVLGNNGEIKAPDHEQQKELKYLTCVIKESMRFAPTVTQLRRFPTKDLSLSDGTRIKKGLAVLLPIYLHHRNPEIFSKPEEFNPDRFEDPYGKESSAWMPFGMGTRTCIGMNFSLIEQKVILSMLLQKYDFKLGSESSKWDHDNYNSGSLMHIENPDIDFIPRV
ncbi:cytochrome P450 [Neoconidiobolus thromboides FSU 785]|nr:cytochrome P450 [Neoconidiobolus thromboides FSU 785]